MSASTNGHSRSLSIASVISSSPKKKDTGRIRRSIERPKVITPVIAEKLFGSVIGTRTASLPTYQEIGPPDLVHLSKYNSLIKKEDGDYHYITGIDVSSPTAPMSYLVMLNLNNPSASFKHPVIYTYCSFNVFRRCDVRIKTQFPQESQGYYSHDLQVLPSDRNSKVLNEVSDEIWEELYVSGLVRSLLTGVDIQRKAPGLMEKTPIQNSQQAKRAITAFIKFLDRGALFGANSLVDKPSGSENHLIDALLILADLTGLHSYAIDEINAKWKTGMDVVLTKLLLSSDRELDAVRFLHSRLSQNPRNVLLLNEQVKFLISKGRQDIALKCALAAVKASPLNSEAWYNLTKCHILNNDIEAALVSLNSMPMYGVKIKDSAIPEKKDVMFLNEPTEGKVKFVWSTATQIWGRDSNNLLPFSPPYEVESVDPALLRISRNTNQGTYKRAYELLVIMVNKVGWDSVLKARSEVFLMDQELMNLSSNSLPQTSTLKELKGKRQCDRWLDDLFGILYHDLRVVLIVENELANDKPVKHSALEWSLIGLASFRTQHFKNAVSSLRTSFNSSFDIVAAKSLLSLWEMRYTSRESRVMGIFTKANDFTLGLDALLEALLYVISYNLRFYNEFSLDVLLFLKHLFLIFDPEYIKNKIQVIFENDNTDQSNSGVIPPFDQLVALCCGFNQQA